MFECYETYKVNLGAIYIAEQVNNVSEVLFITY